MCGADADVRPHRLDGRRYVYRAIDQFGPELFIYGTEESHGYLAGSHMYSAGQLNLPLIGLWVRLLHVPTRVLLPFILLFSFTGTYAVSGNVFASVRPKAVELRGEPSRRVVFDGNVLTDADSDHAKLEGSALGDALLLAASHDPRDDLDQLGPVRDAVAANGLPSPQSRVHVVGTVREKSPALLQEWQDSGILESAGQRTQAVGPQRRPCEPQG